MMSFISVSNVLKLHEYPSCTVVNTYQPKSQGESSIRSVSLAKDGGWLVLVPHLGPAEILRPKDQPAILHTIHGIPEATCATFYNTTKKNLAVGTTEGDILIYNIKTRSVKKRFPKLASSVTRLEFTSNDHYLVAAGSANGEAYVYNSSSNVLRSTLKVPRSTGITTFRTSFLKKNHISVGSEEGVVAVWDLNTNKYKLSIGAHKSPITALATSPIRADILVSAALDRQFCFYDITEGKCIASIFVENSVASIDFIPDGQSVAMGTQNGKVHFYDMRKLQQPVKTVDAHAGPIKHLIFYKNADHDGSTISLGGEESTKSDIPPASPQVDASLSVCSLLSPGLNLGSESAASLNADSFMQAMAMNNTASSDASLPKFDKKLCPMYTPIHSHRLSQNMKNVVQEPGMTSTPNPNQGPDISVCPVTPLEQPGTLTSTLNDHQASEIRKIVREEMGEVVEDMKNFIAEKVNEVTRMQMNHGMMNVKDNIKIENYFEKLFDNICNASDMGALMEENTVLKQRITFLEEVIQNNQNNL